MQKFKRHRVRIIYREDELLILDFKKFAFTIEQELESCQSYVYPPKHYRCCFLKWLKSVDLALYCKEVALILPRDYRHAKKLANFCGAFLPTEDLHEFLKKVFPDHFSLLVK